MKESLLDLLACPNCHGQLNSQAQILEDGEIKEGNLSCGSCSAAFPIRNFIPRFVPHDSYVDTFSLEWNKFRKVQIDAINQTKESEETFTDKTGFCEHDVRAKLILDAGVGAGRFADVVSRWGGEVVGVDLSFAVDAAYKNIGRRKHVHLVQADIFNLPFRHEIFDLIFSMGVLMATPDTRTAFTKLLPHLNETGEIAIWVYGHGCAYPGSERLRKITTRLPMKVVYYFSAIAIPLYYLYRIKAARYFLYPIFPISIHQNYLWRWLDTFDWYAPKYQWKHSYPEIYRWFKEAGLREIRLFDYPIAVRGKRSADISDDLQSCLEHHAQPVPAKSVLLGDIQLDTNPSRAQSTRTA